MFGAPEHGAPEHRDEQRPERGEQGHRGLHDGVASRHGHLPHLKEYVARRCRC